MHGVIQLDRSGIAAPGAQRRKLGMARAEILDIAHELRGGAAGPQVCMALRAGGIGSGREARESSMLLVAGGTFRSKDLIGVMNRAVMAGKAGAVAGLRLKKPAISKWQASHFAASTACAGDIGPPLYTRLLPRKSVPGDPENGQQRNGDREPEAPAPKRMRALEIIHVNALRAFLCCSLSVGHGDSPRFTSGAKAPISNGFNVGAKAPTP